MNNPKVIILCGPPCSGKSTWIKHNNPDNLSVLSTDNFVEEKAKEFNTTYTEIWESSIQDAVLQFKKDLNSFTKRKESFIIDQTNLNPKARRKKLISCSDYYKIAVYFEVSLETLLKRNTQRPGKVIPEEVMNSMMNSYQRPTTEEGFDLVMNGTKLETVQTVSQTQLLYDMILDI